MFPLCPLHKPQARKSQKQTATRPGWQSPGPAPEPALLAGGREVATKKQQQATVTAKAGSGAHPPRGREGSGYKETTANNSSSEERAGSFQGRRERHAARRRRDGNLRTGPGSLGLPSVPLSREVLNFPARAEQASLSCGKGRAVRSSCRREGR